MASEPGLRIWYQLISAETGMSRFLKATQALCDAAAAPGTEVEVRGTTRGAMGDQYRVLWHYDVREIIENGLKIRQQGGYDAYVVANSLDPGLVELREVLDIPVVSFMEVCCFTACTMGERFALLVPHERMIPRYREIPHGYGIGGRLASVEAIGYAPGSDAMFAEDDVAQRYVDQMEAAGKRAVDRGAEVLIAAGSPAAMLAQRNIFTIAGVPILHSYGLLVKAAEMAVAMHRMTGTSVSRKLLYEAPSADLMNRSADLRGVELLRSPAAD